MSSKSLKDLKNQQQDFLGSLGPHQQFHELFEHLPGVYLFYKDAESRLMGASHPIMQRLGLEHDEEIVGTSDHDYFPPHLADKFVEDDKRVIKTGEPLINRVEIWYTEQRLLDWFVTTKLPLRNVGGTIVGVMGTVRSYEGSRREFQLHSQIDEAVEYIREHHRGRISVQELADLTGVSARQLHRRFIESFGMSAQDFITKTRIQAATDELSRTDRPISAIAQEFGFCDQSAFGKQFFKHTGCSPSEFRTRHRNQ